MNLEHIYRDLISEREDRLEHSGLIKGTCKEYCPYFEYIERTLRNDINKYEKDILIKKYYRSSAGRNKAFPEDVRPIEVLQSVLTYLFQFIDFSIESYKFLENRTRAIRLDISIQDLECDTTIQILECICRFHILYSYALYDNKEFESHLNLEQTKKILSTLVELYGKRNKFNEEFIGYNTLISFDDKFALNNQHIVKGKLCLFNNIKSAYSQNNLYTFFKLSRTTDFLSYCLLHTYFDKVRLKGIEIYSKCFVEKINFNLIKKMLYLSDKELVSLCKKTNVVLNDDTIDFKNKDLFENDDVLVKDRKVLMKSSKLVYFGDIDYHIKRFIIKNYIYKYIFNNQNDNQSDNQNDNRELINRGVINKELINREVINKEVINKKVRFDFSITEEDIINIILKIYCKVFAFIFVRDIRKKVSVFEKKKRLAKLMCNYILDLYIKKRVSKNKTSITTTSNTNNIIDSVIIITDDSIFAAIFINNVKKSPLLSYSPIFIQYKDINLPLLLNYKVSCFACNQKYLIDINRQYFMLNKVVDTPQNMNKRLEEVISLINKSTRIVKSKLNLLLDNKSRIKQISIITYLIHNGRNPDIKESWIEKIDKKQRVDNIEVYYEENARLY